MTSFDSKYGGISMASSLPNMSSIPMNENSKSAQDQRMRNKYYLSLGMNRPSFPPPVQSNPTPINSTENSVRDSKTSVTFSSTNHVKSISPYESTASSPSEGSPIIGKERAATIGFITKDRPINVDPSTPPTEYSNRSRRSNTTPIPLLNPTNTPSAPINMPLGSFSRRAHLSSSGGFDSEDEEDFNPMNKSTDDFPPQTFEEDFFLQKQQKMRNSSKNQTKNTTKNHPTHRSTPSTDSEDESFGKQPFIPPHLLMKQNASSFAVGTAHSLAVLENRRRNMMDNL